MEGDKGICAWPRGRRSKVIFPGEWDVIRPLTKGRCRTGKETIQPESVSWMGVSPHSKRKDPSPGSLRSPPSPQGRGPLSYVFLLPALSQGERVARCRRFDQPERAG
jgi:hypothetical protein